MEQFLQVETLVIELLLIVSLVAIAVRRLKIPYTVALVVVGLVLTLQQPPELTLTPTVILALFVPPLVFEAAFHLSFAELRRNLASILVLAIPGVILTLFIVGGFVYWMTDLRLPVALVFGALIAATDPVAVVAIFRVLRAPKRLAVLVQGESLVNDGTAIVMFNLMLAVAVTGQFSVMDGILEFGRVAVGGVMVGSVLGWLVARLIARVDDYLVETTLTTVLAFGAYLVAERLHFSGVLAVVAAGLINGNIGPQGMSPTTRTVLFSFWEYVAFLSNSLVFLLIGLQVNLPALLSAWQMILVAVLGVLVARLIVVYGMSWIVNRVAQPVPVLWQHVLAWSGLRGAISLALALTLPAALGDDRNVVWVMTYGVVLISLLVQGTTMRPLLRRLQIDRRTPAHEAYELSHARLTALRAAEKHLDNLHRQGLISTPGWEKLRPRLAAQSAALATQVRQVLADQPAVEAEELDTAWRELLRAQRSALWGLRQDGVISDEVCERLTAEVDSALHTNDSLPSPEPGGPASADSPAA